MEENQNEITITKENEQTNKRSIKSIIFELLIYVLIMLCCIFIVPKYVVQRTIVDGQSMTPTLQDEDNLIVNKLSYVFSDPDRYDIVVFYPNENEYFVKRVIGLPGETIQIINSDVYINGKIIEDSHRKEATINDAGIAANPVKLGEDEFFVMGDNRNGSTDSRDGEYCGIVKKEQIDGKVVLRIYPFNSFGLVD